jgi:hypothetical protein
LLVLARQVLEVVDYLGGLSASALVFSDCFHEVRGGSIVQEENSLAQPSYGSLWIFYEINNLWHYRRAFRTKLAVQTE